MKSCWNCGSSVPDSHRYCLTCGSDTTRGPTSQDPMIGQTVVGKYKIESQLGSGAMGTIYKAEQVMLGKTVVIKVLHKHLLSDPELIQRFHREARAASRLNHPNCVQIIDFGSTDDGALYIAMEYIQGIDLATLLERSHPVDLRRLIHIVKQVCQALDEAHANGVLHRDLKPENIMIENRRTAVDYVKVVDFGIAKLEENNPNSKRSFQTRTGIVCGTPEYMSPEQARGQKLDARSDMYAIGVMLYHMTTDRLPFEADSPIEVVTKHISEPPEPPSKYRKDLPEAFEQLILALLEKDREKRPASAMDVHAELERIDRELAQARREKIEEKSNDDATKIDMRPISELIEAIDMDLPAVSVKASPAKKPSEGGPPASASRPEARPAASPARTSAGGGPAPAATGLPATRANRGPRPVPAAAHSAQEPDPEDVVSAPKSAAEEDTLPEAVGKKVAGKIASQVAKEGRRSDVPARAAGALGPAAVKANRPSVAHLRESVTVDVPTTPSGAGGGALAGLADEVGEPLGTRSRLKLWLIIVGVAVVAGVGTVIAVTQ